MTFASPLAHFLVQPFFWVLALLLVAVFYRSQRVRRILLGISIGLLLLFSNPFLHRLTTQAWEPPPVALNDLAVPTPYDYGVVLGGFTRMYATPLDRLHLNDSANRFSQAIELYHRKKVKKLVFVSGSNTADLPPVNEAELARETAVRFGVEKADVIALPTSRNTFENAVEFREFLGDESESASLLLVTSASHMRRAQACFRKQGLDPALFPTDHRTNYDPSARETFGSLLLPNPATFTAWKTLFREWLAMMTYRVRGRV